MTAEQAKKLLEDRDLRVIESRTGIAYSVLWRLKNGKVKTVTPRVAFLLGAYQNG